MAGNTAHSSGVAERYANALFELAAEGKTLPAVEKDLDRFTGLIEESADFARLVRSPVFSSDEQLRAVTAILEKDDIGGLVANLVKVAAANRRLFVVPDMISAFKRLAATERGEVAAEVTSAEPLSDAQTADLKGGAQGPRSARMSRLPPTSMRR